MTGARNRGEAAAWSVPLAHDPVPRCEWEGGAVLVEAPKTLERKRATGEGSNVSATEAAIERHPPPHDHRLETGEGEPRAQTPVVAAVEPETVRVTAATATALATELGAPVVFVHVRPDLPGNPARTGYQRRLTKALYLGRYALDHALATATRAGVSAHAEVVEGDPATRILEFAGRRRARLLVVGARRRSFGRSVSQRLIHAGEIPVVVAGPPVAR